MERLRTYKKYGGVISYSDEDGLFFGSLHGINDLVTFEGDSVANLKAAFKEAVDDYLASCEAMGKQPEKVYKGQFNVRVSAPLHRLAALHAAQQRITLNKWVENAMKKALERSADEVS